MNKFFVLSYIVLFILEFLLLEGNGTYPFPEAFLALIFLNIENIYLPLEAFLLGIMMDLSTNTIGVFTFSYTFYAILIRLFSNYVMDFESDYLKIPIFFIFDILVKITNIAIIYLKSGYINISFMDFVIAVFIDCLIFIGLNRFYKRT